MASCAAGVPNAGFKTWTVSVLASPSSSCRALVSSLNPITECMESIMLQCHYCKGRGSIYYVIK